MRASSDGTATPVTVVRGDHVDVLRFQARLVERAQQRLAAELDRVLDEDLVGVTEVGSATSTAPAAAPGAGC